MNLSELMRCLGRMVDPKHNPFQKEALLYNQLQNSKVQCDTCWHQCIIHEGNYGHCRTRINSRGRLYCLNYGLVSSYSVNPIEKKPLFHYYPGTYASTVGSFSCNFSCPWCQNWSVSKVYPSEVQFPRYLSPEDLVGKAENDPKISGISISFNEPTLSLEYALDVFNLCKVHTYQMFVTNGYMTPQALDCMINAGLTGMSITVKGNADTVKKYCKTDVEKVWDNIKLASEKEVHVEIICLIISTVNDTNEFFRQIATRIIEISKGIPLHFTQFHPDYQFTHVDATTVDTLERAHQIAQTEGLNYIYLGNIPGHPLENTYCPNCQKLLIKRTGYYIEKMFDVQTGRCPFCSTKIPLFLN